MIKALLIRHITFMLLAAMFCAVIPVHQLLHKHTSTASSDKGSKTIQLKKVEKPCCKHFDSLTGDTDHVLSTNPVQQSVSIVYAVGFFSRFVRPFLQLTNKAPPASAA
jgi:hypothetical protein